MPHCPLLNWKGVFFFFFRPSKLLLALNMCGFSWSLWTIFHRWSGFRSGIRLAISLEACCSVGQTRAESGPRGGAPGNNFFYWNSSGLDHRNSLWVSNVQEMASQLLNLHVPFFQCPPLQNCLSECVYKCSGGVINSACRNPIAHHGAASRWPEARGKGAEFKDRSNCIAQCKEGAGGRGVLQILIRNGGTMGWLIEESISLFPMWFSHIFETWWLTVNSKKQLQMAPGRMSTQRGGRWVGPQLKL